MSDATEYMPLEAGDSKDPEVEEAAEEKYCWICLETEISIQRDGWLMPCMCIGSTKWVHTDCLERWLVELEQNNPEEPLRCTQCLTQYLIVYPPPGRLEKIFDVIDEKWEIFASHLSFGVSCACAFWTCMTFGAITLYQIVGFEQGQELLRYNNRIYFVFALPFIPIALVACNPMDWERHLWRYLHGRHFFRNFFNIFEYVEPQILAQIERMPEELLPPPDEDNEQRAHTAPRASLARRICFGLILPTAASLFGNIFFYRIESRFYRVLLGGFAFTTIHGICKFYLLEQLVRSYTNRQVMHHSNIEAADIPDELDA